MLRAFHDRGLALLLLPLPAESLRAAARRLARQVLREVIGGLLALPAEAVPLIEGPQGPVLEGAARDIRISLSYAGGWALIGLAEGRALGVDLVRIERLPEVEALARLYLPSASRHAVLDAPAGMRDARFAQGWAEMEARSKCLGLPLAEISAERELILERCELMACGQVEGYRIAVAV
ncbi:MAG: hypothetical protein K8H84_14715 [Sulfuricella denitrificans]|nr:hypothetical protein [Sulfuricella denitrificans]